MPGIIFYVYKFDFQDCQNQNFSFVNELKKIYLPQQLNIYTQKNIKNHQMQFAKQMYITTGNLLPPIYSNILNKKVTYLCLNTNSNCNFSLNTINRQLFHYMQNVLNKFILSQDQLNLNILQSQINNVLKEINLSEDYFYQYINTNEFWTYIHVNLIDFLEIFYDIMNKNYPQITKEIFISKLIMDIQKKEDIIYNKSLLVMKKYETNMLKFLKAIFLIYKDTLWKDVKNLLKENFK